MARTRSRCSGCRSRADPTARRAFPAPRSPCGPWPAPRPTARSPGAAARCPARPPPPPDGPPAQPEPPTRPCPAARATPRSTTCTGPPGATTRPYPPYPTTRTRPRSAPCTSPSTSEASPARAPPGSAPAHSLDEELLTRPQDNVSSEILPHPRLTEREQVVEDGD